MKYTHPHVRCAETWQRKNTLLRPVVRITTPRLYNVGLHFAKIDGMQCSTLNVVLQLHRKETRRAENLMFIYRG
jgi:hypothetical protein